jgi:3-hydroxy-9,10-secoandrosta-1,3,5(10)-triene-9,17-dione monooxygenase reductase component
MSIHPATGIDPRPALACLPTGVTILTTASTDGPIGMTTSAVTSLSLDPPLILACLANQSSTLAHIRAHGAFAVNILAAEHDALADRFATGRPSDRFTRITHRTITGLPILHGALAWITCTVTTTHPGGDHTILIGEVTATDHRGGAALVRRRGVYSALT